MALHLPYKSVEVGNMKSIISLLVLGFSCLCEARLPTNSSGIELDEMRGVRIATDDSTSCIPPKLLGFIDELRTRFGRVEINSGYRSPKHNRNVGGARRSQHMNCNALDFKVPGVPRAEVKLFLTAKFSGRAGIGYYCNERFHLDVGTPRQWGSCQPSSREIALARSRYPQTRVVNNTPNSHRNHQYRNYIQEASLATILQ